jgi:hypothetical protein
MDVSSTRRVLYAALTLIILFYMLLPYLDKKYWHAFVPEHQHWFVPQEQTDVNIASIDTPIDNACDNCSNDVMPTSVTSETVIHAFSPSMGLQVFSIVMSLLGLVILAISPSLVFRLTTTPLLLKSAFVPPLDPPPDFA